MNIRTLRKIAANNLDEVDYEINYNNKDKTYITRIKYNTNSLDKKWGISFKISKENLINCSINTYKIHIAASYMALKRVLIKYYCKELKNINKEPYGYFADYYDNITLMGEFEAYELDPLGNNNLSENHPFYKKYKDTNLFLNFSKNMPSLKEIEDEYIKQLQED